MRLREIVRVARHTDVYAHACALARAGMTMPSRRRVAAAKRKLCAIVRAPSEGPAAEMYRTLLRAACTNPEIMDAAFRATQELRDAGTLERDQAKDIFRALFQQRNRRIYGHMPRAGVWKGIEAAFYDMRGERRLANEVFVGSIQRTASTLSPSPGRCGVF